MTKAKIAIEKLDLNQNKLVGGEGLIITSLSKHHNYVGTLVALAIIAWRTWISFMRWLAQL